MKLGKLPARPGAVKLALADYLDTTTLPKPPTNIGHENLVASWGMLGNDQYGDCVWAGAGHETFLWNREGNHTLPQITTSTVLSDYTAVTGFNPNDPSTDNGTDMQVAASYRRKTGLLDAMGNRHKVGAYLALRTGDWNQHLQALYIFGAVGIGIKFPASAMDQFNKGLYWSLVKKSPIEGGHYVPLVAKRGTHLVCVTWGQLQNMTRAFFDYYNDESIVYLSPEMLNGQGVTPEGFNLAQLQADLAAIA